MLSTDWKQRIKEKERRRFFVVFLTGKMIGVGLAVGAVWVLALFLHLTEQTATGDTAPPITEVVNATNTAWTWLFFGGGTDILVA